MSIVSQTPQPQIDMAAIEAELRPLSATRLKAVFVECYGKAAESIARAAVCVKLLEERDEKLSGVIPRLQFFRRVASGQVLPDLAWKFAESPARQMIENLPIPDQKKLAKDAVVPVVEPAPGGRFTTRMQDLTKSSKDVVRQVIGDEGVRTPEEQIVYLTMRKTRAAIPAAIAAPVAEEPLTKSVTVKLTESEWAALTINATRARLAPPLMARRGLVQSGVLKEGKA
jgi:hypothetical protein